MSTLLITGTDSGVGKTWIGRALGHALAAAGRRVVAIKPVETGCADATASFEDGALLAAATGQAEPLSALYRFPGPLAPALAAEAAGEAIDLDTMLLRLGGLLVPMTWEWTVVDLARALGAPALVVAVDRLGTINHTLLTLGALELAGLEVAGVVLTTPETPDPSAGTNAAAIARLAGIDRIVTVPRLADPAAASREIQPIIGWIPLSISSAAGPGG